jgi:hypothetical protein
MFAKTRMTRSVVLEARQYKILSRHFFLRLFRNDLVDFEDQMKERVIGILAILAVFSGLLGYFFLEKYGYTPDRGQSWIEIMFMITFFMLVIGLVAILEWDVMFPDKRDYANLRPLPLRVRTVLSAKFTSLFMFIGLFALSLNLLSSPFFILLLPHWRSSNVFYLFSSTLVHFMIMFLACFFGFIIYIVLFSVFQSLLGARLFFRASTYLRSFFLIVQFFLILIYIRILVYGLDNLISTKQLLSNLPKVGRFFNYFPPFWFSDLYETILGSPRLPFHGRYKYALAGLVVAASVFIMTMGLNYGRSLQRNDTSHKPRFRKIRPFLNTFFNNLFLRNRTQRAIFHFYRKTLKSSVFHRMRLATYFACGVALIPFLITLRTVQKGHLLGINLTLISIPIVLSFALVLGLRSLMNVPVSLEANWIFRLTERPKILAYFTAIRKAILLMNLGPLFALVFITYSILWDPRSALYHTLYGFSLSILVMEVLFVRFIKVPFACSYLPGKERIQVYWLPYFLGFIAYVNIASRIELQLLKSPSNFVFFFATVLLGVTGIRIYQIFILYRKEKIQYEDEPEPVMIGLDYKMPLHKRGR